MDQQRSDKVDGDKVRGDKVIAMPKIVQVSLAERAAQVLRQADPPAKVFNQREGLEQETESKLPQSRRLAYVHIDAIRPNPYQTREIVSDEELEELVQSIRKKGVLQPVLVRPVHGEGSEETPFELVAGERRLRAAVRAGLGVVPAIVQELNDREGVELSIIENAQRENLNPIEEALAYRYLVKEFGLTQAEIADVIGKSRVAVSNALRLLQLEPSVIELLKQEELTAGHGRALLTLEEPEQQLQFAKTIINRALSVRAAEKLIAQFLDGDQPSRPNKQPAETPSFERQQTKIANLLGIEQVRLGIDNEGRRRLNLVFDTEAAWKRFMGKIR